jgi:hypothetical protein
MAIRYLITLNGGSFDKLSISQDALAVHAGPGQIAVFTGDDVLPHRIMEICEGWLKLWNGIRDRNLLPLTDGITGPIASGFGIDSRTENNRRTSWDDILIFLNPDDVAISIHDDVAQSLGATNMIENGVRMLIDGVKESTYKAA